MVSKEDIEKFHLLDGEYTINPDGSVDVDGDVEISNSDLDHFPFKFGKVSGYFSIVVSGELISLEGCPDVVTEFFHISSKCVKSLRGCPKWVGGDFIMDNNGLKVLDYFPEYVGKIISLSYNELNTLEGLPKEINILQCNNNQISTLKGCSQVINSHIILNNNKLTNFEFGPKLIRGDISCENNEITDLIGFPSTLGVAHLKDNPVFKIIQLVPEKYETKFISLLSEFDAIRGKTIIYQRLEKAYEILCDRHFHILEKKGYR